MVRGGPERRLRSNRAGMRLLLPAAVRHGLALAAGGAGIEGCLLATPPWRYPLPAPPPGPQLLALLRQGPVTRARWARVFEHLDRLHPPPPHWYLATLGVVPEARGSGLGRALLDCLLARADADACPCYLETDRPENLAFYHAAGFEVERESEILGVRIWHMQREARDAPRALAGTRGTAASPDRL